MTTPAETLANLKANHEAAVAELERLEKAIATEQQRKRDSDQLHTATMAELRPALTAAREMEAGYRAMIPKTRTPRTTTPAPAPEDDGFMVSQED